jgi:predicted dehydrogenase
MKVTPANFNIFESRGEKSAPLLRVAVIGCGWAARSLHAGGLRRSGAGRIVAACDPLEKARAAIGVSEQFADWREMLAAVECDVVLIASPPAEHVAAAVAAIESGRHVMLEKPLATTLEDAQRIAEAAWNFGRVVAVGFNQRCHPKLVRMRTQIARGEWGRLESVHVRWFTSAGLGARGWLGERAQGGGALLDLGSHVVDLWRFLSGEEIESVSAESRSVIIDDESATLRARMRSGAQMMAELSLVSWDRFEMEICCRKKRVMLKPYGRGFTESYAAQWRVFARAVRGEGAVAAGIGDGLESLRWLLEAARGLEVRSAEVWPKIEFPLTVISSTTVGYQAIRTTLAHLRQQTVASKIELVMVGPSLESLAAPAEELSEFGAVVRVAIGPVRSIAHANAAGIRRARGRVVALTEDHCFPEPGWAEALLRAHEDGWSVVGPVLRNGNPGSMVSEADFAIAYGPWMVPKGREEMQFLSGHNSSYIRDELLALGGRLERLMEAETVLHMEWSAQGRRLGVEPAAVVRHINYSLWRSWIKVQLLAGRLFGGLRAEGWPRRRHLFFAAASPLIPVVRLWRISREYTRFGRSMSGLLRILPALTLGLALDGFGQFLGYLIGPGEAMQRLTRYEFNRMEHVKKEERKLWISQ